jgi:hypothetical protein
MNGDRSRESREPLENPSFWEKRGIWEVDIATNDRHDTGSIWERSISVGVRITRFDWVARQSITAICYFGTALLHDVCDLIANSALFKRIFKVSHYNSSVQVSVNASTIEPM